MCRAWCWPRSLCRPPPSSSGAQETYRDPKAPGAERVRGLLSRMALEEKAAQLCSIWFGKGRLLGPDGSFSPEKAKAGIELQVE